MEYKYTVNEKTIDTTLGEKQILIPFGDVHRDTANCDEDRWRYFLKNAENISRDNPSTWFVSMGDTHDFASLSEVSKIKQSKLHDTTIDKFDLMAQEDNRKFCKEIGFMRGKLLGFVEGNHNWTMTDGKTANEDLAERMGSESLGWVCHYTLHFNFGNRNTSTDVHLVLCHGKAGGKTAGNSVNQVAWLKEIFPVADIYIEGHDHERWVRPLSVLRPTHGRGGMKIKQLEQYLCRSGSFMRGYVPGKASYVVQGLYRPSNLGSIQLLIGFRRDKRKGEDRIVTEIQALV